MPTTVRSIASRPAFWIATAGMTLAIGFGCSSSSSSPTTTGGCDGGACADTSTPADGGTDTSTGGGDGSHDAPAADALYGQCALKGGFGWPCTLSATGPDPTDCTDPNYPDCFVGGQGGWCTKTCTGLADCAGGDAGCVPTACNNKGYCK